MTVKRIGILLAALLLLSGCGQKGAEPPAGLREGVTLSAIVEEISGQLDLPPMMTLTTGDVTALLGLREDDLAEGIALVAQQEEQVECLLAVQAAAGKEEETNRAMQQELRLRREDAARNHPALTAWAAEGRLVTAGSHYFLFILGQGEDPVAQSDALEEQLRGYFAAG